MKNSKNPRITLVGAGPGDADLITVKGLKAIQQADAVLYDALVNPELLDHAPAHAVRLYVGKRKGEKAYEQDEINALLVQYALLHGHVVRLKGGDSFVFGRGMEEVLFARQMGVETEVVPGISSSIAVPALAGIPVSHRGVAQSFWVITATLADGSINPELGMAATSNATVVVLMGLHKIGEIAAIFNQYQRGDVPAAVISQGSLPTQKSIIATIGTLQAKALEEDIKAPAIIVIGEVVTVEQKAREAISLASIQGITAAQNQQAYAKRNGNNK